MKTTPANELITKVLSLPEAARLTDSSVNKWIADALNKYLSQGQTLSSEEIALCLVGVINALTGTYGTENALNVVFTQEHGSEFSKVLRFEPRTSKEELLDVAL